VRYLSEYKTSQRQNNPDDKVLFEAASRISKLGERENLTLDELLDVLRARCLPTQGANHLIERQRKQST
jgi:hypothetical protein